MKSALGPYRHEVSVLNSRSVLECLSLEKIWEGFGLALIFEQILVSGLNVSFHKLIFNDRSLLKLGP